MSDLIDAEAMERDVADEEMRNQIKLMEYEYQSMETNSSI